MARRRRIVEGGAYPHEGKEVAVKCGWCMSGEHDSCRPSFVSSLTRATYVCPCECRQAPKKKGRSRARAKD